MTIIQPYEVVVTWGCIFIVTCCIIKSIDLSTVLCSVGLLCLLTCIIFSQVMLIVNDSHNKPLVGLVRTGGRKVKPRGSTTAKFLTNIYTR